VFPRGHDAVAVKILWKVFLVLLAALILDQVAQWVALRDARAFGMRVAPYDPPIFTDDQLTSLMQVDALVPDGDLAELGLDAELGWGPRPGQRDARFTYDWAGARTDDSPLRRPRSPGLTRVVTLGGALVRGDGVGDLETWQALLEQARPDLEVANLGVADHGLDQVLLRLRRDGFPLQPDEVWVGFRPRQSLLLTTVYPPALDHDWPRVVFKPRFELGEKGLVLVPNPATEASDYMRLLSDQRAFGFAVGPHDLWLRLHPNSWAPGGSHWTHHLATTRLLLTFFEDGRRSPEPWLLDGESEVFRLIQALVVQLRDETVEQGALFRLLVLPDQADLRWRQRNGGQGYWSNLIVQLAARGVDVIELSGSLQTAGALSGSHLWTAGGLYSLPLNRAVADLLAERISPNVLSR
jgi:hypothetical protein